MVPASPRFGAVRLSTDPSPPVAGQPASLFVDVLDRTSPQAGASGAEDDLALRLVCRQCAKSPQLERIARVVAPQDRAPDALQGYAALVTFPEPGRWTVIPPGQEIVVRAQDSFEPPFVHVRPWTAPLPEQCGRPEIADLVGRFVQGFNDGDAEILRGTVGPLFDFSSAGAPPASFASQDRDAFVAYALERHRIGERWRPLVVYVACCGGPYPGVGIAFTIVRDAPDLVSASPGTGRRASGKGAVSCAERRILHWNMALLSR